MIILCSASPPSQEASRWANSGIVLPSLSQSALRPNCLVFDFGGRKALQLRVRSFRGIIRSARTFVISGCSRPIIVGGLRLFNNMHILLMSLGRWKHPMSPLYQAGRPCAPGAAGASNCGSSGGGNLSTIVAWMNCCPEYSPRTRSVDK